MLAQKFRFCNTLPHILNEIDRDEDDSYNPTVVQIEIIVLHSHCGTGGGGSGGVCVCVVCTIAHAVTTRMLCFVGTDEQPISRLDIA